MEGSFGEDHDGPPVEAPQQPAHRHTGRGGLGQEVGRPGHASGRRFFGGRLLEADRHGGVPLHERDPLQRPHKEAGRHPFPGDRRGRRQAVPVRHARHQRRGDDGNGRDEVLPDVAGPHRGLHRDHARRVRGGRDRHAFRLRQKHSGRAHAHPAEQRHRVDAVRGDDPAGPVQGGGPHDRQRVRGDRGPRAREG